MLTIPKICLVRHGETDWNRQGRVQGRSDVALSETGRQQVRILGNSFPDLPVDLILASPQIRARETASILSAYVGVEVLEDESLREIDCGRWEGELAKDILKRERDLFDAWIGDETVSAPNGESMMDILARTESVLSRLEKMQKGVRNAVIVSHAAISRALTSHLLDIPIRHLLRFTLDPASVAKLRFTETSNHYRMRYWNRRPC